MRFSASVIQQNSGAISGLVSRLVGLRDSVIVGVPEGVANNQGTSLSMIAAVHEFGGTIKVKNHHIKIPARPFLVPALKQNRNKYGRILSSKASAILLGRMSIRQALELVGMAAEADVKAYIRNGTFTPLAAATIRRKKSSKPLIDTGQLRQSIRYQVVRQ